jgi:hypothetical protein
VPICVICGRNFEARLLKTRVQGLLRTPLPCCPSPETLNLKIMAAAVEAYCVKCKAKRTMKDPKENTMANGRKAMKGTCPTCGTGMFKILGKA